MDIPKTIFPDLYKNKGLLYVLIAAIIIRFFIYAISLNNADSFVSNDTKGYHDTALTWIENGSFSLSLEYPEIPETVRTPGYPLFLGIIYKIFGVSYKWVILIQVLLSVLSLLIIYTIGVVLFNPKIGSCITLIFSFDTISTSMCFKVLSETLFQFFILFFLLLGILWVKNPYSRSIPVLTGLFLGIATLIRPISYYLGPFIFLGVACWYLINKYPVKKFGTQLILFSIPLFLLLGGWQIRNKIYAGNSSFSQISGINLIYYRGAQILANSEDITFYEARKRLLGEIKQKPWEYAGLNPELNINKKWQKKGLEIMIKNPLLTSSIIIKGMFFTLFGPGDGYLAYTLGYQMGKGGPLGDLFDLDIQAFIDKWIMKNRYYFFIFIYSIVYLFILYTGILIWIYNSIISLKFNWYDGFLWGTMIYFLLISAGPEAYFRFRIPIVPILSIYSVLGWHNLLKHRGWIKL